ncbi:hypothetical protein E8P82_06195 [Arthrobacter echini]|uniref:HTH marR-type domain-containing protein n=1 Tax=Arthrobacter echini TaxID=1529066 RepID=A0A4S5E669_9MICC|nr:hypothetical protein [Arthrobacter echini]THJ67034.1 hypothetical protein E8P82_06195 [Arthrobacter echini]
MNKLKADGLIERRPSRVDGRWEPVHLTEKGRETVDRVLPAHVNSERELLEHLSAAQQNILAEVLVSRPLNMPPLLERCSSVER